jgi:hypothetical protein
MMRRTKILLATASMAGLMTAYAPGAIATPVSTGAAAASMPAYTGSATLAASLGLTGSLGGLLDGLISPIVNQALDPLVAALQGSLNTTVASALGVSSSYRAGSPTVQSTHLVGTFASDLPANLPSPCDTTSTSLPCYSGTRSSTLSLPSLVTFDVGALRGYTQQADVSIDSTNSIFGRAQIASATVAVLPALTTLVSPLVSVGAIDAKANCPVSRVPTASVSTTSLTLLGGAVSVAIANGALSTITVSGTPYTLSTLPSVAVAGFTLSSYGTALKLTIPLTPTEIVTGLGLSGTAVTNLLSYAVTGTTLSLSVIIGPSTVVTSTSAQAWGLGVGVDLSGSLSFDLLGLVGATVSVPSGVGGGNVGNVLDARLAYTSCNKPTGTTSTSTAVVPPALI